MGIAPGLVIAVADKRSDVHANQLEALSVKHSSQCRALPRISKHFLLEQCQGECANKYSFTRYESDTVHKRRHFHERNLVILNQFLYALNKCLITAISVRSLGSQDIRRVLYSYQARLCNVMLGGART